MLTATQTARERVLFSFHDFIDKAINEIESEEDSDTYKDFKKQYWDKPAGFVNDCIDWSKVPNSDGLAEYQLNGLNKLVEKKRICMRGPHGLGKSAMAALIILWYSLTRDGKNWKIVTTASAHAQLKHYLWPEVHVWERCIKWDVVGRGPLIKRKELLDLSIKLETGAAIAVTPTDHRRIEGAHAPHILYLFDEAKAIDDRTFDAAEGAFASIGESFVIAISTPEDFNGRFYEIQSRKPAYEDWHVIKVTLEETIEAGRVSREWAEARKRQWGEKSSIYIRRVLGDFAAESTDSIFPLAWIEQAQANWRHWRDEGFPGAQVRLGADIARYGDDSIIIAEYAVGDEYEGITWMKQYNKKSTMETTGYIVNLMTAGVANIDVLNMGAGTVDRLREISRQKNKSWKINAFNAGLKTSWKETSSSPGFVNVRAASYFNLKTLLDPDRESPLLFCLPDDQEVTGDLLAQKKATDSSGKIRLVPKKEIKKELRRSPDKGDTIVIASWTRNFADAGYFIGF